jgi:Fe2+ or Zn2+ uptake regulation protein
MNYRRIRTHYTFRSVIRRYNRAHKTRLSFGHLSIAYVVYKLHCEDRRLTSATIYKRLAKDGYQLSYRTIQRNISYLTLIGVIEKVNMIERGSFQVQVYRTAPQLFLFLTALERLSKNARLMF